MARRGPPTNANWVVWVVWQSGNRLRGVGNLLRSPSGALHKSPLQHRINPDYRYPRSMRLKDYQASREWRRFPRLTDSVQLSAVDAGACSLATIPVAQRPRRAVHRAPLTNAPIELVFEAAGTRLLPAHARGFTIQKQQLHSTIRRLAGNSSGERLFELPAAWRRWGSQC